MSHIYIIITTIAATTLTTAAYVCYKCLMKSLQAELTKNLTIEQLEELDKFLCANVIQKE